MTKNACGSVINGSRQRPWQRPHLPRIKKKNNTNKHKAHLSIASCLHKLTPKVLFLQSNHTGINFNNLCMCEILNRYFSRMESFWNDVFRFGCCGWPLSSLKLEVKIVLYFFHSGRSHNCLLRLV